MTDTSREPGYRGSLPPQNDRLAKPWVVTVIILTILIFALAWLDVPTRFLPEPTVSPSPTASAGASGSPGASGSATP